MSGASNTQPARGRRRDFERNREAILEAANECFVELGAKASIDAIAKRAGVGPATVYRHFPTRSDLERAVFDVRLGEYATAIEAAQLSEDPTQAFRGTIHAIVALQAADRSFRDLVSADRDRLIDSETMPRFSTALFGAFDRAHRDGVIRDDVRNEDVMLMLIATEGVAGSVARQSPEALERLVSILLDGICGERSTLGGAALSWLQLLEAAQA